MEKKGALEMSVVLRMDGIAWVRMMRVVVEKWWKKGVVEMIDGWDICDNCGNKKCSWKKCCVRYDIEEMGMNVVVERWNRK